MFDPEKKDSPIIKATCGCVVLPVPVVPSGLGGFTHCVVFYNCDACVDDPEYSFNLRDIDTAKILGGTPLTAEQITALADGVSALITAGDRAMRIVEIHAMIGRMKDRVRESLDTFHGLAAVPVTP